MCPYRKFGRIAFVCCLGCFGILAASGAIPLVASYLAAISLVTVGFYGYDKAIAGTGSTRVPEGVFYGLAFAGGAAAGLLAQQLFRHKTRKTDFLATCAAILVVQGLAVGLVTYLI